MTRVGAGFSLLLAATAIAALLLLAVPAAGQPTKPSSMFVFGDSFADTGNSNKTKPVKSFGIGFAWGYPYGITWPGHPAGRSSNGRVSTDYLAGLIGVPRPRAYRSIGHRSSPQGFRHGINFAVASAGVLPYDNVPSIAQQVAQFEGFLARHPNLFDLKHSVVFLFVSGSDYLHYFAQKESTTEAEWRQLVDRVVRGIATNVGNLYLLGLRNFALGNLQPAGCVPVSNPQGYTTCNRTLQRLSNYHNQQLFAAISNLRTTLTDSEIVVLDLNKAFSFVNQHPQWFGIKQPLGACCQGVNQSHNCGDYDAKGRPLFTLCANPQEWFFWDAFNPTDAGWESVAALFYSGLYTTDSTPNLLYWLNTLDLGAANTPSITRDQYIALAVRLVQRLNRTGDYPQLMRLASENNSTVAAAVSKNLPAGVLNRVVPVTAFLPTEAAVEQEVGTETLRRFPPVASEIGLQHVVYGAWPLSRLTASNGQWLQTLAGYSVQVVVKDGAIFLSSGTSRKSVRVINPDLFVAPGVGVVHQISAVLIPPALYLP